MGHLPKPAISDLYIELDSRPIQENPIVTWEDTSGNSRDCPAVNSPAWFNEGWLFQKLGSVFMNNQVGQQQHFTAPLGNLINRDMTIFIVFFSDTMRLADDPATAGPQFIGGDGVALLSRLTVNVNAVDHLTDPGRVSFRFHDTSAPFDDDTFTGNNVVSEGVMARITCRHDQATDRIIRVNGVQEGSSIGTQHLNSYPNPTIGAAGGFYGTKDLGWLSIHEKAVSNSDILLFEAWLLQEFGSLAWTQGEPPVTTVWT